MDLIVAFSFSLMPDGAPGSYNVELARHLGERLVDEAQKSDWPVIAMQWEIADALKALFPELVAALYDENKIVVVRPPIFKKEEITQEQFDACLKSAVSEDSQVLYDRISMAPGDDTGEKLNFLLTDGRLYERFQGLALENLIRPELGDLFTEYRRLPVTSSYPDGLGTHQRVRVNRLIIERIVDDTRALQRGRYLSTGGVIDKVCGYCEMSNQALRTVGIVAHSFHLPRCITQSKQTFARRGFEVQVEAAGLSAPLPWDETGAQVWCRSHANWLGYEEIVQTMMNKPRR